MPDQSSKQSRKVRRAKATAAGLAIAAFGVGTGLIAAGCGSDDEDNVDSINNAIDSVQSQAQSVQTQIDTAQEQAKSISTNIQGQVESVQSQIQTATQNNGGSGAGGY
jgi:protein involved in sex pheromone biosynthesis